MLSGQNVFHGMEGTEVLEHILAGRRQPLDHVDDEMVRLSAPVKRAARLTGGTSQAAIVRRCWRENPLERPTMPELVSLLSSDSDESDMTGTLAVFGVC